ncbi:type VI secretion system membrane subunit TssM [Lichenicola sp.]|uniref:type VI secretion system membrane subunit TssM n=1 Tax=Lichenicola sp. TaxID=2804529 RepID=UPI003AFFD1B6
MNTNLQYLVAMLLGRWTTSFAGLAIAGMLAWYLGPLIPGLSSTLSRALLIFLFVLIWFGVNGILSWRRRRRGRALAAAVVDGGAAPPHRSGRTEENEEVSQLRARLRASLAVLRKAQGHRGALYEQPWFLMIGPPGAGKTTALSQCGLRFPLAQPDGTGGVSPGSVAGVGGTRLCDWWFSDEAVLIDTAGRYTTQDSDESVDRAGWLGFLDLLRKTRPKQPLNGVLVVISLADVATVPAAERLSHARAIRSRIKEASDRLGVRLPVYAVFSKADRIAGFTEFFDDLDQQARQQVWGMTFPLSKGVEIFASEFQLLLDRLEGRLYERLQAERSPDRRVAIAGFPLQIASLEAPLTDFLQAAFGGTKLDRAPMLRGVYFSSGTQEGTPIDRLTGLLARTFGIDQKRAPSLRPVAGRAYFIGRTIRDVILGEALLVSANPASVRRRRIWRWSGFGTVGVVTVVASLLLWRDAEANRAAIAHDQAAIDAYSRTLVGLPLDPVADDDLPRVLPVLDAARQLPGNDGAAADTMPVLIHRTRFDIAQADKVGATDRLAYRHALERVLLPRLIWRVEGQMRAHLDSPEFLYEATRVYLMLGNDGPLDPNLVRDWMMLDWADRYPGPVMQPQRDALLRHLNALLADPLPTIPLDGALVREARSTFSRVPPAERVYSRVRPGAAATAVPPWTPAAVLGSGTGDSQLFTRLSGRPMTDGIPGFYTAEGFRSVLLPALSAAVREVADESWVLGRPDEAAAPNASTQSLQALEAGVIGLYAADYERLWDAMLRDLALVPFQGHADTVQKLYVMASPQSPMRDLLVSIVHELAPAGAAAQAQAAGAGTGKTGQPKGADPQASRLAAVFDQHAANGEPAPPLGHEIDDHYRDLIDFTGPSGQAPPITGVFRLLNQLQSELAQLPGSDNPSGVLQGSQAPAQLLLAEADRQPPPVSRWLHQIATGGAAMVGGDAHQAAASAFTGSEGPSKLCHQVVDGHYPFEPEATTDAPIDDFVRLLAPGGALDAYFKTQLRPYVNTSGETWHAQSLGGVPAPVTDAAVASFQQAARIRDLFFPTGGSTPSVHFTIKPLSADPASKQVVLMLGQNAVTWQPGAVHSTSMTWPADNLSEVGLTFKPVASFPLHEEGPWSLFRLFGNASIEQADEPGHFLVHFRSGAREATFSVETGSAQSPLDQNVLQNFHCPVVQ